MKLLEIAERIGGVVEGSGDVEIKAVAGLKEASSGDISFLANPKYAILTNRLLVFCIWNAKVSCST